MYDTFFVPPLSAANSRSIRDYGPKERTLGRRALAPRFEVRRMCGKDGGLTRQFPASRQPRCPPATKTPILCNAYSVFKDLTATVTQALPASCCKHR